VARPVASTGRVRHSPSTAGRFVVPVAAEQGEQQEDDQVD
jgi:hypothetical protein